MRNKSCLPEITFHDYCQKFLEDSYVTSIRPQKERLILEDFKLNRLDKKQKQDFRSFIFSAIDQTKQIRVEATKEATKTFGNPEKWLRVKKEYFRQPEFKHKTVIDCYQIDAPVQLNYTRWRCNEQLNKTQRSVSVRKTFNSSRRSQYNC